MRDRSAYLLVVVFFFVQRFVQYFWLVLVVGSIVVVGLVFGLLILVFGDGGGLFRFVSDFCVSVTHETQIGECE